MTLEEKIEFLQNENAKLLARALEAEHRRAIAEKQYSNLLMKLNDLKGTQLTAYPWELKDFADENGMRIRKEDAKSKSQFTDNEDEPTFTWHDLIDSKKRGGEWNIGNGLT